MITIKKEFGQGGKFVNTDLYKVLQGISAFASLDVATVPIPASLANSAAVINAAIGGAALKFSQDIVLTLKDEDGNTLIGFSGSVGPIGILTLAETSGSGVLAFDTDTVLTVNGNVKPIFVEGVAIVTVDYTGTWSGGTLQIETITATKGTGIRQVRTITCTAGESTGAGDITMTVTAAGMSNSPKDVVVAIGAEDDTVTEVGDLVRAALALDADVSSFFTVSGTAGAVVLTTIIPVADDATLDNTFVDTDTTGVTFGASVDTQVGVAPAAGDITMTITSAGMDNSPKDVVVAIGATDYDVGDIGALIRAALGLDADVSAFFTVSGTGANVILTKIAPATANDATLAFGFVDTDTTGVTFGSSTNTAAGVVTDTATLTITNATMAEANSGSAQTVIDTLLP